MFLMAFLATWWFWLVALEIGLIFWFLAVDHGDWASYSVVAFLVLLWFVPGGSEFFLWASANPKTLGWVALGYFPLGAVWGVVKWMLFAYDRLDEFKEKASTFESFYARKVDALKTKHEAEQAKRHTYGEIYGDERDDRKELVIAFTAPDKTKEFKDYLKKELGDFWPKKYPPQISDHKADYIRWMSYWPFSFIYTITHDFVRRVARAVYNAVSKYLQMISDWVFSRGDVQIPK